MRYRKVRLSRIEKKQVIDHINAWKKRPIKPIYTTLGGVFGELHFWR